MIGPIPHLPERIASQVEADGAQPYELSRTRSRNYSSMNLIGFLDLGAMARHVEVDLLNWAAPSGASIRKAVDWLMPYAAEEKEWEWQQITDFDIGRYCMIFRRAANYYQDTAYENVLNSFDRNAVAAQRLNLLYPPAV